MISPYKMRTPLFDLFISHALNVLRPLVDRATPLNAFREGNHIQPGSKAVSWTGQMTRSFEKTDAKTRQEHAADHAVGNKGALRGFVKRFKNSVGGFKKGHQVSKTDFWTGKLNVLATTPPHSVANSVGCEHYEDVYDATAGFDSHRSSVHPLTYDCGEKSNRSAPWVGSLFTATQDSIVSRVTFRMRAKQGTDFSFRVVIADWSVSELGLPHSTRVQCQRVCQSPAPLQPLYVSEPMLLRPSGRADGFRDVECVLPNAGSGDAVPICRDQTLLFAIIPYLTHDLDFEDPGKAAAVAEVACVERVASGPLLHGLLWNKSGLLNHTPTAVHADDCAGLGLLATEGLESDEQGRAMALKVHFIPGRENTDSVGCGHGFVASAAPELPLLLDRNAAPASKARMQKRRGTVAGGFSDILAHGAFDAARLRKEMPRRCRDGDWERLYSSRHHGVSIHTLFQRVTGRRDTVLLIKDSVGNVFGAFIPVEWKNSKDFYGTGECFVFQLYPRLVKHNWTGANSMFLSTSMSGLVIGGGGKAAIWLDSEFNHGGSGPCSTFDSPCLSSRDLFTCIHLEVWAVGGDPCGLDADRGELLAQMFEWHFYLRAFHKAFRSPHLKLQLTDSSSQPPYRDGHGTAGAGEDGQSEEARKSKSMEQTRPGPMEVSGTVTVTFGSAAAAGSATGLQGCSASEGAALEGGGGHRALEDPTGAKRTAAAQAEDGCLCGGVGAVVEVVGEMPEEPRGRGRSAMAVADAEAEERPRQGGAGPVCDQGAVVCDPGALRTAARRVCGVVGGREGGVEEEVEQDVPNAKCFCFVSWPRSRLGGRAEMSGKGAGSE